MINEYHDDILRHLLKVHTSKEHELIGDNNTGNSSTGNSPAIKRAGDTNLHDHNGRRRPLQSSISARGREYYLPQNGPPDNNGHQVHHQYSSNHNGNGQGKQERLVTPASIPAPSDASSSSSSLLQLQQATKDRDHNRPLTSTSTFTLTAGGASSASPPAQVDANGSKQYAPLQPVSGDSDIAPDPINVAGEDDEVSLQREQEISADCDTSADQVISIRFEPVIEFLSNRDSSFEADEKVCQLIESGARAIIGPIDGASIAHVQSICDNLEIPYFELRPFLGSGGPGSSVGGGSVVALTTPAAPSTSFHALPADSLSSRDAPARQINLSATGSKKNLRQRGRSIDPEAATETIDVPQATEANAAPAPVGPTAESSDGHLDGKGGGNGTGSSEHGSTSNESNNNNNVLIRARTTLGIKNWTAKVGVLNGAERANDLSGSSSSQEQEQEPESSARQSMNTINDEARAQWSRAATTTVPGKLLHQQHQRRQRYLQRRETAARGDQTEDRTRSVGRIDRDSDEAEETGRGRGSSDLDVVVVNLASSSDIGPANISVSAAVARSKKPSNTGAPSIDGLNVLEVPALRESSMERRSGASSSEDGSWRLSADTDNSDNGHRRPPRAGRSSPSTVNVNANYRIEDLTMNLYPPAHLLNIAYMDLIYALNWTSFAIVYETGNSLIKFQDLFRESSTPSAGSSSSAHSVSNKWRIRLFSYDASQYEPEQPRRDAAAGPAAHGQGRPGRGLGNESRADQQDQPRPLSVYMTSEARRQSTFRDVFWKVKSSGERNILLDVSREKLHDALKHAQQVGCMTEDFSFIIASLDLHTIDMEDFKYSRTKISAYSLIQVAKMDQQALSLRDRKDNLLQVSTTRAKLSDRSIAAGKPIFDEKYLELLGVHVIEGTGNGDNADGEGEGGPHGQHMTPSSFATSSDQANSEFSRREMLQSSPESLGLLPTLNRNNEQKLFDFYLAQQDLNLTHVRLSTSSAILHDSLILYLLALNELHDPGGDYLLSDQPTIGCSLNSKPWLPGSSLVNYMRRLSFNGLTGPISFDQQGLRNNLKLDLMGMAPNLKLVKVGEWHSKLALESMSRGRFKNFSPNKASSNSHSHSDKAPSNQSSSGKAIKDTRKNDTSAAAAAMMMMHHQQVKSSTKSYEELSASYEIELKNYMSMLAEGKHVEVPYKKSVSPNGGLLVNDIIFEHLYFDKADQIETLIVTAKLSQPYFMLKETPNKLEGNDRFEGFAVDLIHELSKLVNFKYIWREVADQKYGNKEEFKNGTVVWNGMIGEIVRGVADLALGDLTITAQREEAVDFTLPFMNTGISILFKKPTTKVTTLFSFLSPFSSDVWAYVLAAYCGISGILFLVGHISPYEWADPHPCRHALNEDDLVLKNQFSLLNSFWFTIGSLMQQGSDLTPRSMSTRTIAGIWYFFTLIMISSYTANLAAFLTVEKVVYPIENVQDLSNQDEIKYGCVQSGTTCLFFKDSQIDTYKKIYDNIENMKTSVSSNDAGQKRVGEGKYAFFMESTTIEYIVERNCNLTQIGGLIDSKGYGLAFSKKSRLKRPYRTLLNEGILHLEETGILLALKNRWWKERRGGGTCADDGKGGGVTELSLANVGGVFVVLLGGLGISFLVAIAEFMWKARQSGFSRDNMCEGMMNDLKFALACKNSTKPISKSHIQRSSKGTKRLTMMRQQQQLYQKQLRQQQYQKQQSGSNSLFGPQETFEYSSLADITLQTRVEQQQQQQLLSQPQQKFNQKDYDPILLHAMLTMLMQQQEEQNQRQTLADAATNSRMQLEKRSAANQQQYDDGAELISAHRSSLAVVGRANHIDSIANNKIAPVTATFSTSMPMSLQQNERFSIPRSNDKMFSVSHGSNMIGADDCHNEAGDSGASGANRAYEHENHMMIGQKLDDANKHFQPHNRLAHKTGLASTSSSNVGRRRLLYAQRTIDLADDQNFP